MNTSTVPSGVTPTSAAEKVSSGASKILNAADVTSADRVQHLSLVHQARVSRLTRTAVAAAKQYGENSVQANAARTAVASAKSAVARVELVYRQMATTEPKVALDGWALHGRVYDAQLKPVVGYTVFLADAQRKYQEAYGYASTDSTGYFLLNSTVKASPSLELYVEIADTSAQTVYLSAVPFEPVTGNASYQNITLPAGDAAPGKLPEAIRKVAMPPGKL
jgi:hypothetical protein